MYNVVYHVDTLLLEHLSILLNVVTYGSMDDVDVHFGVKLWPLISLLTFLL